LRTNKRSGMRNYSPSIWNIVTWSIESLSGELQTAIRG